MIKHEIVLGVRWAGMEESRSGILEGDIRHLTCFSMLSTGPCGAASVFCALVRLITSHKDRKLGISQSEMFH